MPRKPMKGRTVAMICPSHGYVPGSKCPKCAERTVGEGAAVHIFKPMVYTDICETPLLIESKAQLKRECKKHNVIACRLM